MSFSFYFIYFIILPNGELYKSLRTLEYVLISEANAFVVALCPILFADFHSREWELRAAIDFMQINKIKYIRCKVEPSNLLVHRDQLLSLSFIYLFILLVQNWLSQNDHKNCENNLPLVKSLDNLFKQYVETPRPFTTTTTLLSTLIQTGDFAKSFANPSLKSNYLVIFSFH